MRLNERKRMELVGNHYETWGHISLEHLAIPETVKVTVMGTPFIPTSFNIYGEPNFTDEAAMLYEWKENEIRRQPGMEKFILEADISYEERIFDIPRKEFDSIQEIGESTYDLESFNQMLNNRRLFRKVSDENLNEFVVFGKYWLDQFGQVWVRNTPIDSNIAMSRILHASYFNSLVGGCGYSGGAYIPNAGDVCPCCGKKFTIEDVEHADFGALKGKICHDACRREYEHQRD